MNEFKDKNVLVVGGCGFIGSSVARKLVDREANVTILDSLAEGFGANNYNLREYEDKIKINVSDIRNFDSLLVQVNNFDIIYNFAGQPAHNRSLENPYLDMEINLVGHLNLLEACKRKNPKARILYSGSRLQIGKIDKIPVNETHPCRPKSPYGVNKQAAEEYSLYFNREVGLDTVVFRISNPYGPRAQMKTSQYCIVNWFMGQLMQGNDITVFGNGTQFRDYIYIDDLVDAYISAGISPKASGQVFNVGSGEGIRFGEMVDKLIETVGKGKRINKPWPSGYHNIETGDYVADITKIETLLDWKPKFSINEGIKETYNFYKKFKKYYF